MTIVKSSKNKAILDDILGVAIIILCLLDVFPDAYYFINIITVLLFTLHHFIEFDYKVSKLDIFVFFITAIEIIFASDFSRISLFVVYLIFQSKRLYTRRSLQVCLRVLLSCFCLVLIAYIFGFNRQYDKVRLDMQKGTYSFTRALGFINPNRCMIYFLSFSCIYILYNRKAVTYIFIWILNYGLYRYTQCRSVFYAITIVVILLLILKLFNLENKRFAIKYFTSFSFLSLLGISLVLPYYSDTNLNILLSGRLDLNRTYLEQGISLFGTTAFDDLLFDSEYLHMIITKGSLYMIFYTGLIIYKDKTSTLTNKQMVLMLAILFIGIVEVVFLRCMIMISMGALFNLEEGKMK